MLVQIYKNVLVDVDKVEAMYISHSHLCVLVSGVEVVICACATATEIATIQGVLLNATNIGV